MKVLNGWLLILALTYFSIDAFGQAPASPGPLILVSKSYSAKTYENWLLAADPRVRIKLMYGMKPDSVSYYLDRAQGVLISGGEDVYPKLYGEPADTSICGPFDTKRDSLEQKMIMYALVHRLPLLGICRGLQLINVTLGGSLYRDLAKEYKTELQHPRLKDIPDKDVNHAIKVNPLSLLGKICQSPQGTVNSAHHQGIKQLGRGLKYAAVAPDGVVESIEWNLSGKGMSFLLGVQWHPERLDYSSPYSLPIAKAFLTEAKAYVPPMKTLQAAPVKTVPMKKTAVKAKKKK